MPRPRDHTGARIGAQITQLLTRGTANPTKQNAIMKLNELNPDQLNELKVNYYAAKLDERGEGMSFGEMCEIDNLVSMEELEAEYGATEFVNDDFCCSFQEIEPIDPTTDQLDEWFRGLTLDELENIYNKSKNDSDFVEWCENTWCDSPFYEKLRIYESINDPDDFDTTRIESIYVDLCVEYDEDYYKVKDALRSMLSENFISKPEYDYIMCNYAA